MRLDKPRGRDSLDAMGLRIGRSPSELQMRILLIFVAAVAMLAGAAPAAAVPTTRQQPMTAAEVDPELARIAEEMEAYGSWLLRVEQAHAPVNQALQDLHAAWQRAAATGDARAMGAALRPLIARTGDLLDRAYSDLETIDAPDFAALDLPQDIRPLMLLPAIRQNNRQLRTAVQSFVPMIDALERNLRRETEAALLTMLDASRLVIEGQVTLGRATLAHTPRDESAWEMANIELVMLRTAGRLLAVLRNLQSGTGDPAVARELLEFAAELETSAREGDEKLGAELAELVAARAEGTDPHDPAFETIMRRVAASLAIARRMFPLANDFAATLRREAGSLGGAGGLRAAQVLSGALREARWEIDRIGTEAAAAMAAD